MAGGKTTENVQTELTEREMEVLKLLASGYSDIEIAERLCLTTVTIRTHVSPILSKLGLKNRLQAALYAYRGGIVQLEEARNLETYL